MPVYFIKSAKFCQAFFGVLTKFSHKILIVFSFILISKIEIGLSWIFCLSIIFVSLWLGKQKPASEG